MAFLPWPPPTPRKRGSDFSPPFVDSARHAGRRSRSENIPPDEKQSEIKQKQRRRVSVYASGQTTGRFSESDALRSINNSARRGAARSPDIYQQLLFSPQDRCFQHVSWYLRGPLGRRGGALALFENTAPLLQSRPATLPQNSISLFTWVSVGQLTAQHVEQ